jgi:hypothetical protein
MSTQSFIGIELKDGTIKSIYCHSDGYLEGVGMTLFEHFQDSRKIKKMIKLGGLSSLGAHVEIPQGQEHSFEKRLNNVCCFYTRDRGEPLSIMKYDDLQDYLENSDNGYDYLYKTQEKAWFMLNQDKKLILLQDALLTNESTFNKTMTLVEKNTLEQSIKKTSKKHKKLKI